VIDQNADGLLQTADRYTTSKAGGFPPSPVGISVQIDGQYYEGVSSGPKVINPPGPTIGRRTKVFWNIDNEAH
jgi:type IV pilus assembly protein PilY1